MTILQRASQITFCCCLVWLLAACADFDMDALDSRRRGESRAFVFSDGS
jgi:hypothetical protein